MFIGYQIQSYEHGHNLLQETIQHCSEQSVPVRPGRWAGVKNSPDESIVRELETVRVDFAFYNNDEAAPKMAELYLKWKALIAKINAELDDEPHQTADLGTPYLLGVIHEKVVDAWTFSKVYPDAIRWFLDPTTQEAILQISFVGYIDEVGVSLSSPLEQLLDLEQSGFLTQ